MTLSHNIAVKTAVFILFFSLLALSSCGDLNNPLLSSSGTYQVKALVNGNSIENCSIIRRDDKIIPYFAVSVVNDPDLTGLLVYLKNPKGDIIGEMVLYTIDPMAEALQPGTTQEEAEQEDNDNDSGDKDPEDNDSGDNDSNGNDPGDNDPVDFWAGENETQWLTEADLSKQIMAKNASVDNKSAVKKYDTVILIKSFDQEMPFFQLSKDMEIGQYTLVFEVFSRTTTLSLTELDIFYIGGVEFRLNDISMYLPWLYDTRLIPPDATVMLEAGLDFDNRLNPYVIWYNGRNIISEGYIREGAGTILWKAPEQSGFYSLRLEVFPYRLKRNFTGIFREITVPVSAKASQTGYFFEIEPDYPAKRPLSAGTAYAEQVKLVAAQTAALTAALAAASVEDKEKTVTMPIPPEYPELIRWYRFDGSLDEVSLTPERVFEPAGKKTPRWAAVEQSYGLSVGQDDTYLLQPVNFIRQGQEQGGGIFLFHIKPATEGTIFSAFFPMLGSVSDGVWMDIVMRKNVLTLRLKTKSSSVEIPVSPDYSGKRGFIPIVAEFYIRTYRFEAKLSIGEDIFMQSVTGEIRLPGVLSGESRIKLGVDKTAPGSTVETKSVLVLPDPALVSPEEDSSETDVDVDEIPAVETIQPAVAVVEVETVQPAAATIWDEFAILYSTTPLLPEEIIIEDNDSGETEDAQEKEEAKPSPAVASKPAETADMSAPVENEAPLADIKAETILIEQAPDEAEDEEVQSLISLP